MFLAKVLAGGRREGGALGARMRWRLACWHLTGSEKPVPGVASTSFCLEPSPTLRQSRQTCVSLPPLGVLQKASLDLLPLTLPFLLLPY